MRLYNIIGLIRDSLSGETRDHTTGSIRRAVFLLSIPMILEMSLTPNSGQWGRLYPDPLGRQGRWKKVKIEDESPFADVKTLLNAKSIHKRFLHKYKIDNILASLPFNIQTEGLINDNPYRSDS